MTLKIASFADHLEARMPLHKSKRKGERTKERLRWAGARLLERDGYLNMRIIDICDLAEVRAGTFYLHFPDKQHLTRDVLTEFIASFYEIMAPWEIAEYSFSLLMESTYRRVLFTELNSGVMSSVLQLARELPSFQDDLNQRTHAAIARQASAIARTADGQLTDPDRLFMTCYAAQGLFDRQLRHMFSHRDTRLDQVRAKVAPSRLELAEFLSVLWHRTVFGKQPRPQTISAARKYVLKRHDGGKTDLYGTGQ